MSTDQNLAALINCENSTIADQGFFPICHVDFDQAKSHGVLTLLHFKLGQLAQEKKSVNLIDRSINDRLTNYTQHCVASEMQLAIEYKQAMALIESYNPIFLKGSVMAYHYYVQPHHRPMADVDLLISENSAGMIKNRLLENGFDLLNSNAGEIVLTQFSCTKKLNNRLALHFDIHCQLFNRPGMHDLLGYNEVMASARRICIFEQDVLAPSACHCLVHACLHLMAHHENSRRLIWLYDIKLILEKFTEDDMTQLFAFTDSKRIAKVVLTAIDACDNVFPLNILNIRSELERQVDNQVGNAHHATGLLLKCTPATLLLSDWRQIIGVRNRLKWLKEHLFPKPEYIQQQYKVKYTPFLPIFYVWRIIKGSVKLFTKIN